MTRSRKTADIPQYRRRPLYRNNSNDRRKPKSALTTRDTNTGYEFRIRMPDTNAGYKYWRRIPETLPTDAGPRAPRGPRRATHQRAVRQQHHHPRADEPNKLLSSSHYTFPNALHFSCFPHLGSQARNFPVATPVIHQFYANTARRTAAGTVHCATRCIPRMRVPRFEQHVHERQQKHNVR